MADTILRGQERKAARYISCSFIRKSLFLFLSICICVSVSRYKHAGAASSEAREDTGPSRAGVKSGLSLGCEEPISGSLQHRMSS